MSTSAESAERFAEAKAENERRWEREQQALISWANAFLSKRNMAVRDLSTDFHDGVLLINLLEQAFRTTVGQYVLQPKTPFHKIANIATAFEFMEKRGIHLISIDANDIVQRRTKQTVNVLWNILRCLTLKGLRDMNAMAGDGASDEGGSGAGVRETLLRWAQRTFGSNGNMPAITDFSQSFEDGLVLCAIVNNLVPGSIDVSSLDPAQGAANLALAMRVAEEQLGIPSLFDPEDFGKDKKNDEKAMENYVCMLISAAQSREKTEAEVKELRERMEHEKAKKAEELDVLRQEVEEGKKQFSVVQEDVERLREMQRKAFDSEQRLNLQLGEAQREKEEFSQKFEALAQQLSQSHEALQRAMGKEQAALEREERLKEQLQQREEELTRREEDVNELRAQVYSMHKEQETIMANVRSKMRTEKSARASITHRGSMPHDLLQAAIRDKKSYSDFLNSMSIKKGWLMKRRPGKDGKKKLLGGNVPKKRFFVLKGDRLYWYVNDGDKKEKGYATLKDYRKVDFDFEMATDPDAEILETKVPRQASRLVNTEDKEDVFVLRLFPKEGHESATAKVMELVEVETVVQDLSSDIYSWVEELNTRIALIDYLTSMFDRSSTTKSCREVVEFITGAATKLVVENKVTDVHEALVHFREPLILRRGLHIVLNNVALTDPSCKVLSEIISKNNTIRSVELPSNMISSTGASHLAKALTLNRSLEVLRLDDNSLRDLGVEELADALATHPDLSTLSLTGNQVTDAGVEALVSGLERSQKKYGRPHVFTSFELADNQVGDAGAAAIARFCLGNNTTTIINLDGNCITDEGAKSLARILHSPDCNIEVLSLAGNQLSSKGVIALAGGLRAYKKPLALDISDNKLVGPQGVKALIDTGLNVQFKGLHVYISPATSSSRLSTGKEE